MDKESIINQTIVFVKQQLSDDSTGHDWWHVQRVWQTAMSLTEQEGGDLFVVQLGALLHDIADWKFQQGDDRKGETVARHWLISIGLQQDITDRVCQIIHEVSFKGAGVETLAQTIEGKIVQDADRLDAMGAIGIARAFAYGGHKGRAMHDPAVKPVLHNSFEQYKTNQSTTINHFYEKLLLLKERMNTVSARKIAEDRHLYMEAFLTKFLGEWDGEEV